MIKQCRLCQASFKVEKEDLDFYRRISPVFGGKTYAVPPPTYCPECRLQRRKAMRNERKLYKRTSDLSGQQIIAAFAADAPYKVYSYKEWWSDEWNALDYGRDYDFTRSFHEQFRELCLAVPHLPLNQSETQNSDYTNYALHMRDCYLVFGASHCEKCLYARTVMHCQDVLDSIALMRCELCYDGITCESCYNCLFTQDCQHCRDCIMVEACQSCSNCALCFGLHQQEYCILNQPVGKTRFEEFKREWFPLTLQKIEQLRSKLQDLAITLPHRQSYIYNSENSSGNMVVNCKNCNYCFDVTGCEDCKYLFWTPDSKDSYDCCFNSPDGVELCYEVCSTLATRSMGLYMCWDDDRCYYCMECHGNHDLFGCVGLRKQEHCIFNKQYSKDDYQALAAKIAEQMTAQGDWGEYFPVQSSWFAYNESIASEVFPMEKEDVLALGWKWRDEQDFEVGEPAGHIPDTILDVDDSITQKILLCQNSGRKFRITPQELDFYRRALLPLPRLCPDERYRLRMQRKTPLQLWKRHCAKSGQEILTPYAPYRPEIIYANDLYKQDFY